MRMLSPCLALLVLALTATTAGADGMFYQLPEDGTWAEFKFRGKMTIMEEDRSITGTIRIASVGRTVEKDEPCRWIEVKLDMNRGGGNDDETSIISKVLVPEKFLVPGNKSLSNAVRAIIKEDEGEPKEVDDPENFEHGPLPMILADPLKKSKELEAREIKSKLGKRSCRGVSGRMSFKPGHSERIAVRVQTWLHPDAPFGVVSNRWTFEEQPPKGDEKKPDEEGSRMKMTWTSTLSDFGTGATSELPDEAPREKVKPEKTGLDKTKDEKEPPEEKRP